MARGTLPVLLSAAADRKKNAQKAGGRARGKGKGPRKVCGSLCAPSPPQRPSLVTAKSRRSEQSGEGNCVQVTSLL